ncbi:MAG TPA: hypothetical protein VF272_02860 [Candidatus Saccharimonadia bacterium]
MSLTNEDLKQIKTLVTDSVEGAEKRLKTSITSEIQASEQRMTRAIVGHSDARYEQLSVQMENGFTHLQNQFRKSIRP